MPLFTGKNSKIAYYLNSYVSNYLPLWLKHWKMKRLLHNVQKRDDYDIICERVNYYCQLDKKQLLSPQHSICIKDSTIKHPKVYYLDSLRYARCFDGNLRWHIEVGDVNYYPRVPSIVKSRPIHGDCSNSTLLNLDKVRHFVFLKDRKAWTDKQNKVIFRGAIGQMEGAAFKKNRFEFMEKYYGHPMVDAGEVMEGGKYINEQWARPKITLYEHLNYKFIMALEGNDVASNLKWIMSSNSIAVMPKPKYETWFMEGRLLPDYHYIQIKDDYSDLEEKMTHYIQHPDEAEAIIQHAHEYVKQFKNSKREKIISLLVLDKYFSKTNQ